MTNMILWHGFCITYNTVVLKSIFAKFIIGKTIADMKHGRM